MANFSVMKYMNKPLADGKKTKTAGSGEGVIKGVDADGDPIDIRLTEVLYVPELEGGLLSVGRMARKGFEVHFCESGCKIVNKSGNIVAVGDRLGNLYKLKTVEEAKSAGVCHSDNCRHLWHRRFGHRDVDVVDRLIKENLSRDMKIIECDKQEVCETCLEEKLARKPFPSVVDRKAKKILDIVHTDLCGPFNNVTPSGNRYFTSLIDDYSRFAVIYLLKEKSEAKNRIKEYVRFCENYFGAKPKVIRSDGRCTPELLPSELAPWRSASDPRAALA